MEKCLWCGKQTDSLFCQGGGQTLTKSNTGESDTVTKSYCLNDFLTVKRLFTKLGSMLSEEMKTYILWEDDIKAWYKSIPFETDKSMVPEILK